MAWVRTTPAGEPRQPGCLAAVPRATCPTSDPVAGRSCRGPFGHDGTMDTGNDHDSTDAEQPDPNAVPPLTTELVEIYSDAIVTVTDAQGRERDAVEAAGEYGDLWLITAYNPYSEEQPLEANERRQAELIEDVSGRGWEFFAANGRSRDGSWSEPGIAIRGIDRADALELGRQWRQHALYHATPEGLSIVETDVDG